MYIRYANTSVERVLLRDDGGEVLCDVTFDAEGRARCRREEYELLVERGYELETEQPSDPDDSEDEENDR